MFRVPCPFNRQIRCFTIQMHTVPLKSENFLSAKPAVQSQHHKHVGRQALHRIEQAFGLIIRQRVDLFLCLPALAGNAPGGIFFQQMIVLR